MKSIPHSRAVSLAGGENRNIFYPTCAYPQASGKWRDSNNAIRQLVERHSFNLNTAASIAAAIHRRMETIFPLMDEMVRHCCHRCPSPCCIFNRGWFDFQDLLFLHLMRERIPPAPLSWKAMGDPCCYLTGDGCEMPRVMRPWACFVYLCPSHREYLQKKNVTVGTSLDKELRRIRFMRMDMEELFIRVVSTGSRLEQ